MGENQEQPLQLSFNAASKIDFQGLHVTSDGGPILVGDLDRGLGSGELIEQHSSVARRGKKTQFPLADLFRQSVYSGLAGYEDVNDAEPLSQDPTFQLIGSGKITRARGRADLAAANVRDGLAGRRGKLHRAGGSQPRTYRHDGHSAEGFTRTAAATGDRAAGEAGQADSDSRGCRLRQAGTVPGAGRAGVKLAIRIPANNILERDFVELLTRPVGRPSHKAVVRYKSFLYQAASWSKARRVVAKVDFHMGDLLPRVGFIVTNLETAERWFREDK